LAQLAHAYGLTPNYSRNASVAELHRVVAEFLPKAEAAGRRAIQLDPGLADAYLALGRVQSNRGKFLPAEDFFSKALELDPNNPDSLTQYSNLLANVGRVKEALAMKQQLRTLEPYVPGFKVDVAELLWVNGQNDAAVAMFKDTPSGTGARLKDIAMIYAAMGHYNDAADVLESTDVGNIPPEMVQPAIALLRKAPASAPVSPQSLPQLGTLGFVYLYAGAPGRALESYENWAEAGYFASGGADNALLWHPSYAPVRKTERFKAFVRATGYVEYWRAKGWPEFCHPTTGDDFVCT
jgi:tetratricopeptide (TPR) repeat protein